MLADFILKAFHSKSNNSEQGREVLGDEEEALTDNESLTMSCSTLVSI